jgi:hypothetical protein
MVSNRDLPVMQNVDTWFADGAISLIKLDRDESDSFNLTIENLSNSEETIPSRAVAFELLPAGSKWTQVVGWHSYIGIPFPPKNPQWIALGAETVVKHGTRGAYPLFCAYVHPFPLSVDLIGRLGKLAASLYQLSGQEAKSVNWTNGLIRATSQSPQQHQWIESWIIQYATKSYREQRSFPLVFRTLILSESQLLGEKYPHPKIANDPPNCMMATVPVIEKTFSPKHIIAVQAHKTERR